LRFWPRSLWSDKPAESSSLMSVWSRKFAKPIVLESGEKIAMLSEARNFILRLNAYDQESAWWQYTAELLQKAAKGGRSKDVQCAADQFGRALSRTKLP
jgi:hypothetical protein